MKNINIKDFFDGDWTLAVNRAIEEAGRQNCTIFFPAGIYNFNSKNAYTEFSCISNHSGDGVRSFGFPLHGCRNIVVMGETGTSFVFEGCMVPFLIEASEKIKLENFNIDWLAPFYSQGMVRRVEQEFFDLEICTGYSADVYDEQFILRNQPFWGVAEMDQENLRMKPGKSLNFREDYPERLRAERLSNGIFRIHGKLKQPPDVNSMLVLRHGKRDTPAIFINDSVGICLSGVSVFQAGGMGVIAQQSRDLEITEFAVEIAPGSKRLFSACADAVHIVNCMGNILIENSRFENQFDDAINIHGVYSIVTEWLSPTTVKAKLEHRSQKGLIIGEPGNLIRFITRDSLKPVAEARIQNIRQYDLEYAIIEFEVELSVYGKSELALENLDYRPEKVIIRNCIAKNSNPRGFLISTGGEVLIENNVISVPGAAIRISGDAGSWFESGPVESVMIRNNSFEFCCYDSHGTSNAVIDIVPEITEFIDDFYYHKEITITGNDFINCEKKIIYGWSVEKLRFENNRITINAEINHLEELSEIKHCGSMCFNENSIVK